MKLFLVIIALFSIILNASDIVSKSVIVHDMQSTRLLERGHLVITTNLTNDINVARINMDYFMKMHWYTFIPNQSGTLIQDLPIEFTREEGYLNLERVNHIDYRDVDIYHNGRWNYLHFTYCHKITIVKKNGEWSAVAYYHPSVSSTGWVLMLLTYNNIPAIGKYTITSKIRL